MPLCFLKFALSSITLLLSMALHAEWHSYQFDVMGTRAAIELWSEDRAEASQRFAQVETEMRRIEALMSSYIDSSEVSQLNRLGSGQAMKVSEELYQVISKSLYFSKVSQGAFDISIGSVGHLYHYRDKVKPTDTALQRGVSAVDWQSIQLRNNNTISFARSNMRIDLGGIAKGHAVDRSIALLQAAGIQSAIVSAGGDSRMIGDRGSVSSGSVNKSGDQANPEAARSTSAQRIPWMVGIRHPRQGEFDGQHAESSSEASTEALRLPLVNAAISTSGDYERYFFDKDEQRIHHIINPGTGRSATGVVSASVIGPESINCDVLSTTLFVLGVKRGLAFIESVAGYDAVLIDASGKVHFSSGLADGG